MKNGKTTAKILVTRKLPPKAENAMAQRFDCTFKQADTATPREELLAGAAGKDAIICTSFEKFPADVIQQLPDTVRIIATVSVGYEHIDLAAASARGITVTNTPDVLTEATADITLLLMLGAARGASWGERAVRQDKWQGFSFVYPLFRDVSGQRLGIVGMGRIGVAVATRAKAFGMSLHYHNRKPSAEAEALGATYHSALESLLPQCDILSLNCPLTPETRGIINARTLAQLPDGAILVNTARGGVVVDDDVIAALQSGKLAAAGLDVFNNEPDIDPRYRTLENVFLLPHLGSATVRTRTNMALRALANVSAFFDGEPPKDKLA